MQLITLSGVDGSGKSTQLQLLKQALEQKGKKVFYFHAVEFSLANRLIRLWKGKKDFVAGEEKASTQASWISLQLRKIFLSLDIFRFKLLTRKLSQEKYDYIISDRYFYDSVINILYLAHDCHPEQSRRTSDSSATIGMTRSETVGMTYIERFIPQPHMAFYLQITTEAIMQRDRVPEQGIEYLTGKIAIFEHKKTSFHFISIDASQSQEAITTDMLQHMNLST